MNGADEYDSDGIVDERGVEYASYGLDPGEADLLLPGESLVSGIWPRSVVLWMAAFWIALVVIRPWEIMFLELAPWRLPRIYAILMILVTLFSMRPRFYLGSLQTLSVIAFVTALAMSSVMAQDPVAAWSPFYVYMTLIAFYFVLVSAVRTPYELLFILISYIVVMAMTLGKAQVEFFVFGDHVTAQGVRRLAGINVTFRDPNAVAEMTVVSLPIALFLWRARKQLSLVWPAFWSKWFTRGLLVYFVLASTSVFLTQSRAGMLGFAFFIFLSMATGKGFGRMLSGTVLAILVLAVLWVALPQKYSDRLETLWNPDAGPVSAQASAEGRKAGRRAGLMMFKRYPVTGVGPGNFPRYRAEHIDGVALVAHNLLGQSLGETGVLGTGAFLLLVFAVLWNCWRTRRLAREHPHPTTNLFAHLALACAHSILLLAMFGLALHNMYRVQWLWTAAFALPMWDFARATAERELFAEETN